MSSPNTYTALTTLAASGNTAAIAMTGLINEVTVYLSGTATWGGGTLKMQASPDGGTTWLDVPSASWTSGAASTKLAVVSPVYGTHIRFNLAGATTPSLTVCVKSEQLAYGDVDQFSLTANGSTASFRIRPSKSAFGSMAYGTWGSGTLTLQCSPDGGTTWFAVDTDTANAMNHIATQTDDLYRYTLSGATTPSLTMKAIH